MTYHHLLIYQTSLLYFSRVRFNDGGCLSNSEEKKAEESLQPMHSLFITSLSSYTLFFSCLFFILYICVRSKYFLTSIYFSGFILNLIDIITIVASLYRFDKFPKNCI